NDAAAATDAVARADGSVELQLLAARHTPPQPDRQLLLRQVDNPIARQLSFTCAGAPCAHGREHVWRRDQPAVRRLPCILLIEVQGVEVAHRNGVPLSIAQAELAEVDLALDTDEGSRGIGD